MSIFSTAKPVARSPLVEQSLNVEIDSTQLTSIRYHFEDWRPARRRLEQCVLMPAYDRINVRTTGNLLVFTHRKVSERNDYFGALIVDCCHHRAFRDPQA